MKNKGRSWKERICALALAVLMVLSGVIPSSPGNVVKAAPGDEVSVTIQVLDQDAPSIVLSDVNIEIKQGGSLITPESDGTYKLVQETVYSYTLSGKTGYADVVGSTFETGGEATQTIPLTMQMESIQAAVEKVSLNVGEAATLSVSNSISGAVYTWASDNPGVAAIEGNSVKAVSEGSAQITASYNGKTSAPITVNVSKNTISINLKADPTSGTDMSSVTLDVENLPDDATGTVAFYVNRGSEPAGVIDASIRQWIYSNDDLRGDYTFRAVYSGDTKYTESTSNVVNANGFNKSQKIVFQDTNAETSPKLVTLPEDSEPKATFQIELDKEQVKNSLTYTSSDESILTVDESGKVTVNNSGSACITVKAEAGNNYLEAENKYYVYVEEDYEFSDLITEGNLTIQPLTRAYNGNTDVTLTATLNPEDLKLFTGDMDASTNLTITIVGLISAKAADSYDKVKVQDITKITGTKDGTETELTDRVKEHIKNYENKEVSSVSITINPRKVYLGTKDLTSIYGTNVKTEVEGKEGLVKEVSNAEDSDSGVVSDDTIDFTEFKATTGKEKYDIGEHEKTIRVYTDDSAYAKYPDYTFVESENDRGKLTVKQATLSLTEDILKNISFSAEGGTLYQDSTDKSKIWISNGTLKASVGTAYAPYYSSVVFKTADSTAIDLTTMGYDVSSVDTGTISGKLFLTDGTNSCAEVEFSFTVDKTAPGFTFGDWTEQTQVLDQWIGAITFNKFMKTSYVIENVSANDEVTDTSLLAAQQSGVKEWSYHVYKIDSDDQLTETALQKYVKDGIVWTNGAGSFIPVLTATDQELKDVQGNYIVLVKVTDNVGNSAVYSSNGVVFDVTDPQIAILASDGTAIDATKYYNDTVGYQVQFTDSDTTSGFASAVIRIMDGETEKEKDEVTFNENKGYTLSEIQDLATKILKDRSVDKAYNSNNLKIEVTAVDQAGNEKKEEQALMIDSKQPVIDVEFNNDSDVKNGKYFNTDRAMTITYTEKNIDKESGITFDVDAGVGISELTADKGVPLSKLSDYGITYEWVSDSEEGKSVSEVTNERKNVLKLYFAKDNEYYIVPHCTDLAGNTESEVRYANDTDYAKEFVIDKTAPVIKSVVYKDADGNALPVGTSVGVYSQTAVTATISITEQNFWLSANEFSTDPEQLDFSGTKETEVALKDVLTTADYREAAAEKSWYSVGEAGTSITFDPDANYTFGFTYKDLAGNEAVYAPHYFTVDKTQPNGTIAIDEQSVWDVIWKVITFDIFKNHSYDITLTSEDATAGVASTAYYKTSQPISQAKVEALADGQWTEGTSFSVAPNEQYVVYARIIDKAGNVRFLYPTDGAVADNTKPEITITNLSTAQNGIFRGDVTLKVDVTDPTAGDTYSGLEKVWYDVTSAGNVVNSKTEVLVDNSANRVQGNQDYSSNIVISASEFNSNDVKVQVHALDFSGNQYDSEIVPLKIDITVPTIQVTYDLNNPSNGKYYNATRTATVTVTERNFDENAVRFNITNTDGTQPAISGWSRSADAGVMDSATNTCTVTFAADGDYTFTLNCTDLAGNDSNYTQVDEFTIDQTVPTISVSFDNNNASNGRYYNAPRTATITVNEHNFNGSEVQTAINASLQSQGITAPGVNGWSTSGDTHSATVYFSADGDYSFTVNYTDLAGNAATAYNVDTFTIDQTKPTVEIFDILDKSANNGTVAPGVNYSDVNYDAANVSITISGAKHKAAALDGTRTSIPNGQSIKMADFAHEEAVDDVYTLNAKVTDLAGNSDEKTVIFSVNRFGSNYIFGDTTEKFLEQYYNNEEEDLIVTEINVDTLEHYGISYGRDGELENLKQGIDYTVKASGNEVSWKSYQYTIKAENFEKEGLYNITIDSKDRATNEVNNKVKDANIEFVIDKTAPTVVITGVEDNKQYKANERDITVVVADNVAMGAMDIYVDDNEHPVQSYDGEDILKQKGELPFTLGSSSNWQKLSAVATDAAGNTAETSEYRVLITSNLLVQFYRNTPLVIGSSVSILAVAALLILLLSKKKKKAEEA